MGIDQLKKGRPPCHHTSAGITLGVMGRQLFKHCIHITPNTLLVTYHCKHSAARTILFVIYEILRSCTNELRDVSKQQS